MATQEGDEEDLRKKKVRQGQWQFLGWVKQSKPAPESHHILNMGDCFCQRLDWKGCMFLPLSVFFFLNKCKFLIN